MSTHHLNRPSSLATALLLAGALAGCEGDRSEAEGFSVLGGDPDRGAEVIELMGCGACHAIPGIDDAAGTVGPPLDAFARRSYIAGAVPNSAANLVRWIREPMSIEPGTAMPGLGLNEQQARDVAAYLYTLD